MEDFINNSASRDYIQKYIDVGMVPDMAIIKGTEEHVEALKTELKYTQERRIFITRVNDLKKIHDEALETFKKKNKDYGDAFAQYGAIGVITRIGDKVSRMVSITNNGAHLVNDESLEDTLMDLHNYAAMAVMLLREKK